MLKHLMGIKDCHQCTKRNGCKLKDDKRALRKNPRVFKKIFLPKQRGVRVPTPVEVNSFCSEFELEKHESRRR